jgi:hypothetical protein
MHAGMDQVTESVPGAEINDDDNDDDNVPGPARDSGPGRLASWLAIGLGLCLTVVNVTMAIRLAKYLFGQSASGSLVFALLLSSLVLGLLLIAFGIILRRSLSAESGWTQASWYVSLAATLLVGAGAFVTTIWAANAIEPDQPAPQSPKACLDLYQQAVPIHKASPNFRLPGNEADQRRCNINGFIRQIGK